MFHCKHHPYLGLPWKPPVTGGERGRFHSALRLMPCQGNAVISQLAMGGTPENIAGWMVYLFHGKKSMKISHENLNGWELGVFFYFWCPMRFLENGANMRISWKKDTGSPWSLGIYWTCWILLHREIELQAIGIYWCYESRNADAMTNTIWISSPKLHRQFRHKRLGYNHI